MTERNPKKPSGPGNPGNAGSPDSPTAGKPTRSLRCEEWEVLLADAIDGMLGEDDSAAFYVHNESCRACATTLEETRKGQQWLRFLHDEPAVPGDLLGRILAQTSGTTGPAMAGELIGGHNLPVPIQGGAGIGGIRVTPLPPLWKRLSVRNSVREFIPALIRRTGEPRMMMTAAMAFFSIALTMNLMGVRVKAVHLADLKPGVLQTNIRRSYNTASAGVSRYYDNLRIVYEVESRMREMQRTSESESESQDDRPAPVRQSDKKRDGSAGKAPAPGGKSQSPRNSGSRAYLSRHTELATLDNGAATIDTTLRNMERRPLGRPDVPADSKERGRS